MTFMADSSFTLGPVAKFLDMPQSPLFTLNLNTPESWMVESVRTRYDLDNIYLQEVCRSAKSIKVNTKVYDITALILLSWTDEL